MPKKLTHWKSYFTGGPKDGAIGPVYSNIQDIGCWPKDLEIPSNRPGYDLLYVREGMKGDSLVHYSFLGWVERGK